MLPEPRLELRPVYVGVNRKTAALYFLRLREIIAYELEAETADMLGGEIEVDESSSVAGAKVNVVAVLRVKFPYLVY